MAGTYTALLRRPGATAFVTAGFIGRLPLSMVTLGIVLLITSHEGSYALAGSMSAVYALAAAFIMPLGARWADRAGQARVVPVLATAQAVALLAFTAAVVMSLPLPLQFALLIVAGGSGPNVGSLVRARWAAILAGDPALRSAFALEAVVDEIVFVVGPPLVTTIAVQVGEPVALAVCTALIMIGCLWLSSQRATQPPVHARPEHEAPVRMMSTSLAVVMLILLLMGGIFGSFEVTTVAFTASLGHEELTGVVLALYALGSLISGLLIGSARLTSGLAQQILVFAVVLAVVTVPLPFVGHVVALAAASFLAGMAVSPMLILAVTVVEHVVPPARLTEALAVTTSGLAVGLAVGSTLAGALIDSRGANAGYALMAGCAVAALLVSTATFPLLRTRLARS